MRMLVFFDLPVTEKAQRKKATQFRNFLLKDGYHMVQFSVYARVCNGVENVSLHEERLKRVMPSEGSVRLLIITEKQYHSIRLLLGEKKAFDTPFSGEQLSIF